MGRRKDLKQKPTSERNIFLSVVLLLSTVLIAIGDIVRYPFRLITYTIPLTFRVAKLLVSELRIASSHWTHEKLTRAPKPKKQKSTPTFTFPKITLPKVTFPTITLPTLVLPTFRTPKISLPHIRLPRIHIPKISLPHIRLPVLKTAGSALPPPPAVIQVTPSKPEQVKSFVAGICVTILFFILPYNAYQWLKTLPNPELLSRRDLEVTTKIFDRNDTLLYEIYADQNRTPLPLATIPKLLQQATIAIEDKDFYRHPGFSISGIVRASRETLLKKQLQGGSTITQQLIKSALLSPEIKLTRKIKEVMLAFWAERLYSKNQILEMYLNQVPYGGTAWGVEAASQTYFGKSVTTLNLAETALLAGLPQAPTEYSPFGSHPEKAFERQKTVLRRMVEDRYITKEEEAIALATPIEFKPPRVSIRAPHFVMYVKDLLVERYGERLVEHGGLRIKTSLDITIQEKAEDILKTQIESLSSLRVGNGAALVTNPKTGEILAMVGSKNYFDLSQDGNVNVTTSLRQPGSSIKVVNYAAALEHGFTAASILDDSPIVYQIPGSEAYAPVNYDSKFHGPVPLRYALANSYNIPAVKILAKIGVGEMVTKGRLMGIESWTDPSRFGLSLTLGAGDVTMLDMARVFGTLANAGRRVDIAPILEVTDYTGRVIETHTNKTGIQAVSPEVAWIMSNILADNIARTQAFGPNSSLVVAGKTVSVKTGTTNEKRDNWTIGYTPSFLTTVWVGNNNNAPMDPYLTSGITGAAPIWHDIMVELLKNKKDEIAAKPDKVIALPCYNNRPEYFIRGTEPAGGRCAPMPTPSISPSPTP